MPIRRHKMTSNIQSACPEEIQTPSEKCLQSAPVRMPTSKNKSKAETERLSQL